MKFKSIAVALLSSLGIMACSSGGGSNHNGLLEKQKAELSKESATKSKAQADLATAQKSLDDQQKALNEAQHNLNVEKAKLAEESAAKSKAQADLAIAQKSLEDQQKALDEAQNNLNVEKAKLAEESAAKSKAQADLATAQKSLDDQQKALNEVQHNLNVEKAKLAEESAAKSKAQADLATAQKSLEDKQNALDNALSELNSRLEAEKALQEEQSKIAEENTKRRAREIEGFKSRMGGEKYNPYPYNQFSTEEIRFMYIDGKYIPLAVNEPLPKESKNGRTVIGQNRVYNQEHSFVAGHLTKATISEEGEIRASRFIIESVSGNLTDAERIPKAGVADYQGKAFGAYGVGDFNYTINFNDKTGSGKISNLIDVTNVADIVLEKGNINGNIIEATAKMENPRFQDARAPYPMAKGSYILGIYGPQAEEVAGRVLLNNVANNMVRAHIKTPENGNSAEIGFAGTKQ